MNPMNPWRGSSRRWDHRHSVAPAYQDADGGDAIDGLAGLTLVGRVGETDDVAAAVAYLSSDHASYITGATLDVNGGYFIH